MSATFTPCRSALLYFAARFEGDLDPDVLAVRVVPEPSISAASAGTFAALAVLASRRRARRPLSGNLWDEAWTAYRPSAGRRASRASSKMRITGPSA